MLKARTVVTTSFLNSQVESLPEGVEIFASSCGLDFWRSSAALHWISSYLNAWPAMLEVRSESRRARLLFLLRPLPFGLRLASSYPYACIEGDEELFWLAASDIAHELRRLRAVRLEIPFSGPYLSQWSKRPAAHNVLLTDHSLDAVRHVLDLKPEDKQPLEDRFDSNIRWALRKSIRNGCSVRLAGNADVPIIQLLYSRTMKAKGAPVNYGAERWAGLISELSPRGQGNIYIGEINGIPSGMAAAADGEISRHLIQLAVPPEAHSSRLGELLVASAMRDAKARGKRYFDFMASPLSDTGLIAYKAKWGTISEPIHYAIFKGIPGVQRLIDLGRWGNRTRARLREA